VFDFNFHIHINIGRINKSWGEAKAAFRPIFKSRRRKAHCRVPTKDIVAMF
jgi:hypothetical protein